MKQQLRKRDKAVVTLLTVLVVIGAIASAVMYFTQRADSAFTAMVRGQYTLARLHYLGLGLDSDHKTAAQLYLDASSAGYAPAQLNLGHLYRQGIGVPQDAVRAFSWYSMSDIHGSPWGEQYMRHTAVEFTLTPGQINSAKENWPTLGKLVDAGL